MTGTASPAILISPCGLPGRNGVWDHVEVLAPRIEQNLGKKLLRIGVTPGKPFEIPGVTTVSRTDQAGLAKILQEFIGPGSRVVLHYVGFGYEVHNYPFYLGRVLGSLKSRMSFDLTTVFHELSAGGPPWKREFYTWPFQRAAWTQIARLSDRVFTSTLFKAQQLERVCRLVSLYPIFSSVGEPLNVPPLHKRRNRALLFGLSGLRARMISSPEFVAAVRALDLKEVLEVNGDHRAFCSLPGLKWTSTPPMSPDELDAELLDSRAGLLLYPPALLTKSGTFAAYAAHGMLTVVIPDGRHEPYVVEPNIHYALAPLRDVSAENLQRIADHAYSWYQERQSVTVATELHTQWLSAREVGLATAI